MHMKCLTIINVQLSSEESCVTPCASLYTVAGNASKLGILGLREMLLIRKKKWPP
jgi:hypothetical protein